MSVTYPHLRLYHNLHEGSHTKLHHKGKGLGILFNLPRARLFGGGIDGTFRLLDDVSIPARYNKLSKSVKRMIPAASRHGGHDPDDGDNGSDWCHSTIHGFSIHWHTWRSLLRTRRGHNNVQGLRGQLRHRQCTLTFDMDQRRGCLLCTSFRGCLHWRAHVLVSCQS